MTLAPLDEGGGTEAHVNFDLELILREVDDEVQGVAGYNAELFDSGTIERLIRYLKTLLEGALREPERPVHELPLLDAAEREQLLRDWSGAAVPSTAVPTTIPRLFSAQAARTPRRRCRRARRCAHDLSRAGGALEPPRPPPPGAGSGTGDRGGPRRGALAGAGDRPAAVLKAGGAYLPMDPTYPPERLSWMLADSGAALLLTRRELASRWPEARMVFLEEVGDKDNKDSRDFKDQDLGTTAYVLYTSGSTGRPKGVVVEPRSLAAYALDAAAAYGLGPGERALQLASVSFDTSAEEIFPALISGATLVLRPEPMLDTVPHFLAELDRLGLRSSICRPPTGTRWLPDLDGAVLPGGVRRVIIGGEQALPAALVQWRRGTAGHPARLVNTYGPTETTIVATRQELGGGTGGSRDSHRTAPRGSPGLRGGPPAFNPCLPAWPASCWWVGWGFPAAISAGRISRRRPSFPTPSARSQAIVSTGPAISSASPREEPWSSWGGSTGR